ncbi:MAG: response regulator [Clostridia bacterium]|nr:response regulator [Clostridia bacterium]
MGKKKVLIADDISIISDTLRMELEKMEGVEVVAIVNNIDLEYKKIIEFEPHIVITDLKFKRDTSINLIKEIQEMEKFRKLVFILITSDTEAGSIVEKNNLKISDILYKPFKYHDIVDIVEKYT